MDMEPSANLLFKMFASSVLQAWAARHAALFGQDDAGDARRMIRDIKKKLGQISPRAATVDGAAALLPVQTSGVQSGGMQPLPATAQYTGTYFDPSLAELNSDIFDMDWSNIDWSAMSEMGRFG